MPVCVCLSCREQFVTSPGEVAAECPWCRAARLSLPQNPKGRVVTSVPPASGGVVVVPTPEMKPVPDRKKLLFRACMAPLRRGKSVCLGEEHTHGALPREMLIRYMELFKILGVEWIGLEAPGMCQEMVDGGDCSLLNALKGKNPGLGDVAQMALKHGIKVVCYDYDMSDEADFPTLVEISRVQGLQKIPEEFDRRGRYGGWGNFTDRLTLMDYYAARKVEPLTSKKYLLLVGADHLGPRPRGQPLQDNLKDKPVAIDGTKF